MSASTRAWLEGLSPDVRGKRYEVAAPATRLGRGSTCDITLTDPMVSREHAEIRTEAGGYTIIDLGSTHGTWVDGQQVKQAALRDGSRLQLGTSEFLVRLPQDAIPTQLAAEVGLPAPFAPGVAATPAVQPPAPSPPPPPAPSPPVHAVASSSGAPPRPSRRRRLIIGCAIAAVVAMCSCLAAFLVIRWLDGRGIAASAGEQVWDAAPAPYTQEDLALALSADLPDERPEILATLGRPDEFEIAVVQVEGGEIRRETWRYFGLGTRVDFVDGAIVWAVELEPPERRIVFPAWYDPTAFTTGMSLAEASALVQRASPAGAVPEPIDLSSGGEDLTGGVLLVGDQITLGFQDGRLVYVETIGANVGEAGG